ncbi:Aste57867_9772 [Aphanomyces stellatus]|uniref:Aste57867_9772 protein n=1 Tax=Aphanomyces stellatus TaxID=120398 RepID=A0A485KNQ4_9STRA|nr:hypothetical protein As57867_009733 [Aphanomyces stellatus]VFT86651.1 Aste57867_9772 [Aphanomyces stellatus]
MKLAYALTALFTSAAAQTEIVGGKEVDQCQHLYVTGLRQTATKSDQCGGSLMAPNVVLTAAHMASATRQARNQAPQEQRQHQRVRLCHLDLGTRLQVRPRPSLVRPIFRGWGTTSSGGSQPNVLMEVEVDALDNAKCAQFLSGNTVDGTMLCAGGKAGEDSCQGDSGGPLTVEQNGSELLVGVVSSGLGCAEQDKPGLRPCLGDS